MLTSDSAIETAHSQEKKGTKAVTGAVPFQKVHFCTLWVHIGTLKGYSTFFGNRLIYHSPRVKQLSFTVFECIQSIF